MAGAKVVNSHMCAWNGENLMIANSAGTVVFNGPVSAQMGEIDDVQPLGASEFAVTGKASGMAACVAAIAKINSSYVVVVLRAR